jgi:pimeloyl-ACP methyl ester carboxylesterase
MVRAGLGEPLILLHGVACGPKHWREVMPLLAPHHDTIALSALGHDGGATPARHPVTIVDVIDDIEAQLDALGLDTAHVAGNSMGGWIALELARRGRARSVCALSPAGTWLIGTDEQMHGATMLRTIEREGRLGRPLRGFLSRFGAVRRHSTRLIAEHGNRLSRRQLIDLATESEACTITQEIIEGAFALTPLDPPPCPITIAWSQMDKLLPIQTNGVRARELVPGATFVVLDGLGHVPMFDDPARVARAILTTTGAT